ncbi:hypothetical protein CXG81DRAFT_16579 [Caulochytrium protostelioides]|uniref:Uncharacterized protein n=1 Tax=Caulochytrium protostelioides TaxID=1555241 RepID=A0A4P9XEM8_9FUNG|nr:hypothetical protein CXG81DRAFT_16579 [Caulochytrium protostelioides]|eukprot:RKP04013.1 hypothetical protein CXG81DRAFT_16579 [Caulochytrium protostelioides]
MRRRRAPSSCAIAVRIPGPSIRDRREGPPRMHAAIRRCRHARAPPTASHRGWPPPPPSSPPPGGATSPFPAPCRMIARISGAVGPGRMTAPWPPPALAPRRASPADADKARGRNSARARCPSARRAAPSRGPPHAAAAAVAAAAAAIAISAHAAACMAMAYQLIPLTDPRMVRLTSRARVGVFACALTRVPRVLCSVAGTGPFGGPGRWGYARRAGPRVASVAASSRRFRDAPSTKDNAGRPLQRARSRDLLRRVLAIGLLHLLHRLNRGMLRWPCLSLPGLAFDPSAKKQQQQQQQKQKKI